MMRGALSISAFVSVLFFPWPFAAILAIASAWYEPLMPLAVGVFADAVYYTIHAARLPWFTVFGAVVSAVVIFVRTRLKTGSMR